MNWEKVIALSLLWAIILFSWAYVVFWDSPDSKLTTGLSSPLWRSGYPIVYAIWPVIAIVTNSIRVSEPIAALLVIEVAWLFVSPAMTAIIIVQDRRLMYFRYRMGEWIGIVCQVVIPFFVFLAWRND